MSYFNLFEVGSNILNLYLSSAASELRNNYSRGSYALPENKKVDKRNYEDKYIKLLHVL